MIDIFEACIFKLYLNMMKAVKMCKHCTKLIDYPVFRRLMSQFNVFEVRKF